MYVLLAHTSYVCVTCKHLKCGAILKIKACLILSFLNISPLSASHPTNCLSVFDHFVGLALKGLTGLNHTNPFPANNPSSFFKGYLRYKTILCHKVALDV